MILPDLRFAVRSLTRAPLFTAAAVLSLALGIATCTIVFSLVNAAMLRPPPFDDAGRITILNITQRTRLQGEVRLRWSWPQFQVLRRMVQTHESVATVSNNVLTITGVDDPSPLPVELVSSGYLNLLRAPYVIGQGFDAEADEPGTAAAAAIVLGHDLWQTRFGGERDVLGRILYVNGIPLTVVGVVAGGFAGVSGLAQAWIPATMAPSVSYADYLTTNQNFITVVGRLRPGIGVDAARSEMAVIGPLIHAQEPSEADWPDDQFSATASTLNEARIDVVTRRALLLLGGAVGVLLLIACVNVANLLLGRAVQRRREFAIRLAIGAPRGTLVRQQLVESGAIAVVAGVLGLLVASWGITALRIPPTLARGRNFYGAVGEFLVPTIDWRVLMFAAAVSACTVVLFGLVPALRATRIDPIVDLKAAGRITGGGLRLGLREFAVAGQVALAVVLIVSTGLLLASYARIRDTRLGFDPSNLLTFMIRPSEVRYPTHAAPALLQSVLDELTRVPGVVAVTLDGCAPLSVQCANAALHIVGRPWVNSTGAPSVLRHYVAPSHFETLGVPLMRGRTLSEDDGAGQPRVVVINEAAAERFWPDQDPIGQRIWFEGAPAFGSPDSSAEIVGIVRNVAYQPLGENPIQPDFFTSFAQFTYPNRMVLVRTQGDPLALVPRIADAVRRADPDLALFDVQTMEARARLSWSKLAFQTALFAVIGVIALTLAVAGVYAVTTAFVSSRIREIGIRIAIGANTVQVVRDSTAMTLRLGLTGLVVGLFAALAVSRIMRAALYETSPLDAGVYAGVAIVIIIAFVVASYTPVRRALRVNPVTVLRNE